MKKLRDGNMELLRIFSIILVLLFHSLFLSNGTPNSQWVGQSPFGTFLYIYFESLCTVCVNCFVLITGYYGIKPKLRNVIRIIFIVIFYHVVFHIISFGIGREQLTLRECIELLNPFSVDWFVSAYLGLMLMSPLLNAFINNSSRNTFRTYMIVYLIIQCSYGYILTESPAFNFINGYSTLAFIGLYLLARYYKLYIEDRVSNSFKKKGLLIYAAISLLTAVMYYLITAFASDWVHFPMCKDMFISYTSPFVILGSLMVMMYFSTIRVTKHLNVIMFFSASVFSTYIIHLSELPFTYFKEQANIIFYDFWPFAWIPLMIVFVISVFILCVLIDQIRIVIYKFLDKSITDKNVKYLGKVR